MIGVDLDQSSLKYSKKGGSITARLARATLALATGRNAWKMATGCLLVLLVCTLYFARVDAMAKDEHIGTLERLTAKQQLDLTRQQALTEASRVSLASSEAIRAQLQSDLATAGQLSKSLQMSLDVATEANVLVKEQLLRIQANVQNVDRTAASLHEQLRARQQEVEALTRDKGHLLTTVEACHGQLNATRAYKLALSMALTTNLVRITEIVERQKAPPDGVSGQQQPPPPEQLHEHLSPLLLTALHAARMLQQEFISPSKQADTAGFEDTPHPPAVDSEEARTHAQFRTTTHDAAADTTASAAATAPPASSTAAEVSLPAGVSDRGYSPARFERPFELGKASNFTPFRFARKQPSRTRLPPEDPNHPRDQVHFVKDRPLHEQPEHIRPEYARDTNPKAPFPEDFKLTGRLTLLSKAQPPDIYAKQQAIRDEFWHAWLGYREHAYGFDELHPISRSGRNSQYYMGLTMIDALDTMLLMGFEQEFAKVRDYLAEYLVFTEQEDINVFETTIRVVGGLLTVYALTGDRMFLDKAEACASGLLVSFETDTGLPYGTVGLRTQVASNPAWAAGSSTVAEVASIQLEWQYLSRATGKPVFEQKVDRVTEQLADLAQPLYPQFINVHTGKFTSETYTFGARVDSLYEYLIKQHLLSGGRKAHVLDMYTSSMRAMDHRLLQQSRAPRSGEEPLSYIAELVGNSLVGKMDHLVCFMPATLALGAWSSSVSAADATRHMAIAKQLMRTCYEMYALTDTGLAPEIVRFHPEGMVVDQGAAHNMLRPETVESLFVMWRVTKDPLYREWGWAIFEAMRKYCRVPDAGYSGLRDVRDKSRPADPTEQWANWSDKMESFFLSETLKYLFLLFSPDEVLPLDEWVFNTEAHPLPIVGTPADRFVATAAAAATSPAKPLTDEAATPFAQAATAAASRTLLEDMSTADLLQQVEQLMQASQRREEESARLQAV